MRQIDHAHVDQLIGDARARLAVRGTAGAGGASERFI